MEALVNLRLAVHRTFASPPTGPSPAMTQAVQDKLALLPDKPGCYLMRDAQGVIVYVGKARNLKNRVRSYFQKGHGHTARVERLVGRIADFDLMVTDTEVEALILENTLIKRHKPYFNIRLRDDKQYPYLMVTMQEEFPRVFVVRQAKADGARYFGPYTHSQAVYQTLQLLRQVFQLASCRLKFSSDNLLKKPCLYHHIHQCLAPCVGYINTEEYHEVAREVCAFLEGKHERLVKRLERLMTHAADTMNFEQAARFRDQRDAVMKMIERQKVVTPDGVDQDVVALARDNGKTVGQLLFIRAGKLVGEDHFILENDAEEEFAVAVSEMVTQYYQDAAQIPREVLLPIEIPDADVVEAWLSERRGSKVSLLTPQRGEKKRLLEMAESNGRESLRQMTQRASDEKNRALEGMEGLQDALDLPALPERIECYDISNIQGTEAVGSMVVLRNGKPDKGSYRRFKIKGLPAEPNDFLMMQQVLRRRLQNALDHDPKFLPLPDLMVIDGGKGQLSAVTAVMEELGVQLPVIGLAKREEEVFIPGQSEPVDLPRHSPGNFMLQRLRDEAHRFALTYHRSLRGRQAVVSMLDQIAGVGRTRRTALLKHFGSVPAMREATLEELAKAPGMNRPVAARLFAALHEDDALSSSTHAADLPNGQDLSDKESDKDHDETVAQESVDIVEAISPTPEHPLGAEGVEPLETSTSAPKKPSTSTPERLFLTTNVIARGGKRRAGGHRR